MYKKASQPLKLETLKTKDIKLHGGISAKMQKRELS